MFEIRRALDVARQMKDHIWPGAGDDLLCLSQIREIGLPPAVDRKINRTSGTINRVDFSALLGQTMAQMSTNKTIRAGDHDFLTAEPAWHLSGIFLLEIVLSG
jgi:hypothetical protein